jgi:hypothetical protein
VLFWITHQNKQIEIKCGSLNVIGFNKFKNDDNFLKFVNTFDTLSICETWSKFKGEFSNFVKSYTCIHFDFVRKMKNNALRGNVGISVFVKCTVH